MLVTSSSPLNPLYNTNAIQASQTEKIIPLQENPQPERSYGRFYDSWPVEAKEAFNAVMDDKYGHLSETQRELQKGGEILSMELSYSLRMVANGRDLNEQNVDSIMKEAEAFRQNGDYSSFSTKEGFSGLMDTLMSVQGDGTEDSGLFQILKEMSDSGYRKLDIGA